MAKQEKVARLAPAAANNPQKRLNTAVLGVFLDTHSLCLINDILRMLPLGGLRSFLVLDRISV